MMSGPGFVHLLLPLSLAAAVRACSGNPNPVRDHRGEPPDSAGDGSVRTDYARHWRSGM